MFPCPCGETNLLLPHGRGNRTRDGSHTVDELVHDLLAIHSPRPEGSRTHRHRRYFTTNTSSSGHVCPRGKHRLTGRATARAGPEESQCPAWPAGRRSLPDNIRGPAGEERGQHDDGVPAVDHDDGPAELRWLSACTQHSSWGVRPCGEVYGDGYRASRDVDDLFLPIMRVGGVSIIDWGFYPRLSINGGGYGHARLDGESNVLRGNGGPGLQNGCRVSEHFLVMRPLLEFSKPVASTEAVYIGVRNKGEDETMCWDCDIEASNSKYTLSHSTCGYRQRTGLRMSQFE